MACSVRSARSKGSQFEMDCEYSLQQFFPDAYRTHERGYIQQYDIISHEGKVVFECKRLKGLSWNEATKTWKKLQEVAPEGYQPFLLFKGNRQPCLVMYTDGAGLCVTTFEVEFGRPFIKHPSTRAIVKKEVVGEPNVV